MSAPAASWCDPAGERRLRQAIRYRGPKLAIKGFTVLTASAREGANFLTKDNDGCNEVVVLKHRHSDGRSNATKLDGVDERWTALGIRLCRCNVGGLDRLLGSDQLAQGDDIRGGTERTASARVPDRLCANDTVRFEKVSAIGATRRME